MPKTLDDAPFLNFFSEEFQADPAAVIEPLREQTWVVRTPIGGFVLGRAQVQALLADKHLRSSVTDIVRMQGITEGRMYERLTQSIIALEGDDHLRIRRLVNRAFTPRATDVHRPHMRATLAALLDPIAPTGRCEFMDEIASRYPIRVMCHVLGVPEDDHEQFATWNRAITWALGFQLGEHFAEVQWGFENLENYVADLMEARRAAPQDDLVTALVHAHEDDDRLSDDEVLSLIASLLFAGYDTTRNQLGLAMNLFTQHPEQWKLLGAEPALAPRAVEEIMRFAGAVSVAPRVVADDFEFEGYFFAAGTILSLGTSAANHDPAAYVEPFVFDITLEREPNFTFGGGPHYCLGASLARAEMQEALPMLAAAMPELALDGEPTWRSPLGIYGPETLPLRWTPATA